MKRVLIFGLVVAGSLSAWAGSAAADGGSGSARACSALPRNSDHGRILVSVANGDVTPSQRRFATCAQALKYSCLLRGAEVGTGVKDVFEVVYSKD